MKLRYKLKPLLNLSFIILNFSLFAQNWEAVPLVSEKIINNGFSGGEGCQVIQAIEIDHTDGTFLLMGTDVGGIYRSIDGGKNWSPCNIGYHPRGNAGFAIDPNNNKRALAVGGNSTKIKATVCISPPTRAQAGNRFYQSEIIKGTEILKIKLNL
jgi:hypothetical protein